jgi:LPS export ABC transporter protein LptC
LFLPPVSYTLGQMAITRRQSLIISGSALLLFFAVGALFLRSSRTGMPITKVAQQDAASGATAASSSSASMQPVSNPESPEPQPVTSQDSSQATSTGVFTMHEFHRSEVRDGRKLWEVKGSQAHYNPESSTVTIADADLLLLGKNGKEGQLRTKQATLFMQGPTLAKAHLEKGVTAIYDQQYTLTSEEAVCDRVANTVVIPGQVKIESAGMELSGDSLKGDIDAQSFVITGNVVTVIKPNAKNPANSLKGVTQ